MRLRMQVMLRSASRSSIVCRRRITDAAPSSTMHFGRHRAAVVVRRHHRAVGAGVEDGEQIADLRAAAKRAISCPACRWSRTAVRRRRRRSRGRAGCDDRLDAVEGVVEHRPDQLGHAGVDDHEQRPARPLLDVDDARQQRARGRDDAAARLEDDREARVAHDRAAARRRSRARSAPACRRRRCRGRRRDRDARWRCRRRAARAPGRRAPRRRGAAASRSVICDPTWRAGRRPRAPATRRGACAQISRTSSMRDAELVGLEAGRDVRVAPRVDVRD